MSPLWARRPRWQCSSDSGRVRVRRGDTPLASCSNRTSRLLSVACGGHTGNTNLQLEGPERDRLRRVGAAAFKGNMNTLHDKVALVTGAASGIGRASALLFASAGAAVVALDRAAGVESTAAAIRSNGGRAVALIGDSSAEADVAGAVALAVKEY